MEKENRPYASKEAAQFFGSELVLTSYILLASSSVLCRCGVAKEMRDS
jgi:hypothetical protein